MCVCLNILIFWYINFNRYISLLKLKYISIKINWPLYIKFENIFNSLKRNLRIANFTESL